MKKLDLHVEVISEGPPKRSLAEIMRDPPMLKMSPPPQGTTLIDELQKAADRFDKDARKFSKMAAKACGSQAASDYAAAADKAANFAAKLRNRIDTIKTTIESYEKVNEHSPDSMITDLIRTIINQLTR